MNLDQIIEIEKAELQCMESCAANGFTIQDYVELKKKVIDMLEAKKEQEK